MKKRFVVDLFAGCGGLSLGLEISGFHPIYVNELNHDALESYLLNRDHIEPKLRHPNFHSNNIKDLVSDPARIKKLKKNFAESFQVKPDHGELDLVVGGPPCQGFSGIGHRRSYSVDKKQLPSNHLYQDMAWVINQLKPKIFMFENVKGLLSSRWTPSGQKGEIWKDVLETYHRIGGYQIQYALVLAKDYGVAQNRPRILMVGIRDDVNKQIKKRQVNSSVAGGYLPEPTYAAPNLEDLLGDLVDSDFEYGGSTVAYPERARGIQKWFRTTKDGESTIGKGGALTEHEYSKHSDRVRKKFSSMLRNNGTIAEEFKTKKFAQRLLPAKWDKNGPTITATSLPDDYVHYSQPRILTVREWARLQGFPDWYQFAGKRTTGGLRRAGNPTSGLHERELPRYTQIGNAVPVQLAKEVGIHFRKLLGEK
jgi:DNA (cytosine-5)-methyltransferase 1